MPARAYLHIVMAMVGISLKVSRDDITVGCSAEKRTLLMLQANHSEAVIFDYVLPRSVSFKVSMS